MVRLTEKSLPACSDELPSSIPVLSEANHAPSKLSNLLTGHPCTSGNHDYPQAVSDYRVEHPYFGGCVKSPHSSHLRDLFDLNPGMGAVRSRPEELELSANPPSNFPRKASAGSYRSGIELERVGIQTPHLR